MSQENVSVVRGMYEAFDSADIPTIIAALDPKVEWWEAENFIYADKNPYVGPDAVLEGVFMRIGNEWEGSQYPPKKFWMPETPRSDMAITLEPTKRTASVSGRSLRISSPSAVGGWSSSSSTLIRHSF